MLKIDRTLKVKWSKSEQDLMCYYPKKSSCNYLFSKVFNDDFEKEMIARGYDITTLKFSIDIIEKVEE